MEKDVIRLNCLDNTRFFIRMVFFHFSMNILIFFGKIILKYSAIFFLVFRYDLTAYSEKKIPFKSYIESIILKKEGLVAIFAN